jgi:hypothetical protein
MKYAKESRWHTFFPELPVLKACLLETGIETV